MTGTEEDHGQEVARDPRGRFAAGASGNPAGKPRGCLNHATRLAAELLAGEAEDLLRAEIELAKAGDRVLLKHCIDRIIGPRRGQPVVFAMPPIEDAGDIAAAVGALLRAVARGDITPAEAETLARTAEAAARTVAEGERIERARLAEEQEAVERRFALRAAALLYWGVREIDEEVRGLDYRLPELAQPLLRTGETVLAALAAIPDTPELIAADQEFLAAHPPRLDRLASPLAAALAEAWDALAAYLTPRVMHRIEQRLAERDPATAPALRRHSGLFERLCGGAAPQPIQP